MGRGEEVSEVVGHAAATPCIRLPTLEATEAIHRARNTGCLSGVHADVAAEVVLAASYLRSIHRDPCMTARHQRAHIKVGTPCKFCATFTAMSMIEREGEGLERYTFER